GYDQVIHTLAPAVEIHRPLIVKEIHWQHGQVRVRAQHATSGDVQEFEARAAVITLPLAVVQSNGARASVEFDPSIPDKIEAARKLKTGHVVKAIIGFDEPFWINRRLEKAAFLHTPDQPFPVFWTTAPLITSVLTGWAGGPAADALAALP